MVAIQKISSDDFNQFKRCKHENLLAIIEAYRFEGQIFAVTNYTATSLLHIIAIPLQLEEVHVSATCHQG
jgi:starvation-inducible outer membrane lipoprotein